MKFVDELPPAHLNRPKGRPAPRWVTELRAHPDRWAEIDRAPKEDAGGLRSRAAYANRTYSDIEAVTRTEGAEVVLYALAVPQ